MNPKRVREISGLSQEQIARALDMSLNGWQRKEQNNTGIRIQLDISESMMAELLLLASDSRKSVSELVSEVFENKGKELLENHLGG